jgi:hypothetical protein
MKWGMSEPFWFATDVASFADRLFELEDDQHARLIELFLDGMIASGYPLDSADHNL